MKKNKIIFIIKASNSWGYGHLYRTIRLCNRLKKNYELIIIANSDPITEKLIFENDLNCFFIEDDFILEFVKNETPKTIVIDRLNNSKDFLIQLKKCVDNIVLLDDQGDGAYLADVLINALVDLPQNKPLKSYFGADYVVHSDEIDAFAELEPIHSSQNKNILLAFGGSDPQNISKIILPIVKTNFEYKFHLILGPGYHGADKFIEKNKDITNLNIYHNLPSLAPIIYESDLCVVSGGITLYECMLLSKRIFVACQVEHQMDSVKRYENDANLVGLGIISEENYEALNKITEFLNGKYNPFREKNVRKFSNGLYKIINIIEELTE